MNKNSLIDAMYDNEYDFNGRINGRLNFSHFRNSRLDVEFEDWEEVEDFLNDMEV